MLSTAAVALTLALVSAADPISRDGAANDARRELQRSVYDDAKPPLLTRILDRVVHFLQDLLDRASGVTPGGGLGLLLLVVLVVVGIVAAVRLGPLRRPQSASTGLDVPIAVTADQLRAQAEQLAGQQQWSDAVRSRLRAVVRLLEDRTLIEPRPGRTAYEVARDAGTVAPALRPPLEQAASTFSEVWYGGRPGTAEDYRAMVALDDAVQRYRLTSAPAPAPTGPAVPA